MYIQYYGKVYKNENKVFTNTYCIHKMYTYIFNKLCHNKPKPMP